MTIDVKVPVLPESVEDATIAAWHKQPGDAITRDVALVDISGKSEAVLPRDELLASARDFAAGLADLAPHSVGAKARPFVRVNMAAMLLNSTRWSKRPMCSQGRGSG